MDFQSANEVAFHGFGNLVIWTSFGNILKSLLVLHKFSTA